MGELLKMRVLCLFALLVAVACAGSLPNVLEVLPSNFGTTVEQNKCLLLEIYSPFCDHCSAFAKDLSTLGGALATKGISVGRVDGLHFKKYTEMFNIEYFPSFVLFSHVGHFDPATVSSNPHIVKFTEEDYSIDSLTNFASSCDPTVEAVTMASSSSPTKLNFVQQGGKQALSATVGDSFTVCLAGIPTTGYAWKLLDSCSQYVSQQGAVRVQDAPPDNFCFDFSLQQSGTCDLVFSFARAWQPASSGQQKATVQMTISTDSEELVSNFRTQHLLFPSIAGAVVLVVVVVAGVLYQYRRNAQAVANSESAAPLVLVEEL